MNVRLHAEAVNDLKSIARYIESHEPRSVEPWLAGLRAKVAGLSVMAQSFPLVSRYRRLGIRMRRYGRYAIFYRIVEASMEVEVLHILHTARDLTALLADWE